jgi:hypothetical protein
MPMPPHPENDAPPPTQAELEELVRQCEDLLQGAWERRPDDNGYLVLGDLNMTGHQDACKVFWWPEAVENMIRSAFAAGMRPMMAYWKSLDVLDAMDRHDNPTIREASRSLRASVALAQAGFVPLLVVAAGGGGRVHVARWAKPGFSLESN